MTRRAPRRLDLKRETLRRLASADMAHVAGGLVARCTYERSGCYGDDGTAHCTTYGCDGGGDDSNYCAA